MTMSAGSGAARTDDPRASKESADGLACPPRKGQIVSIGGVLLAQICGYFRCCDIVPAPLELHFSSIPRHWP
jgi:hypothetical protein